MTPTNSKSVVAFLFDQMEKLDRGEIDENRANAQANLVKQVNCLVRNEFTRAKIQMELTSHNAVYKDGLRLREIESKNFD